LTRKNESRETGGLRNNFAAVASQKPAKQSQSGRFLRIMASMRVPAIRTTALALALLLPGLAYAQPGIITNIPGCDFVTGKMTSACVPMFIAHLIQFVFSLAGVFFILNVMFAGYQIAIGSVPGVGDKEKGKARLTWSIIGFVVTAFSFLIMDLILSVLTERLT
jgi:hypothetical protein